jgi:predicted Zn-dependent peptidase
MIMIVSGDANEAHLALIEKVFSGFSHSKAVTENIEASVQKPFRDLQEKAGSVQSSLRVGKEMISRSHKDYAGVLFVNHILGGYFGSRLMKNILMHRCTRYSTKVTSSSAPM